MFLRQLSYAIKNYLNAPKAFITFSCVLLAKGLVASVHGKNLLFYAINKQQAFLPLVGRARPGYISIAGDSGVVESSGDRTCRWLLTVDDGYAVEIIFGSFEVSKY